MFQKSIRYPLFFSKPSKGFTLIELLVVIAIIAILSAMGLASYQNAAKSGRDGKRKGDLSQVRAALELYRSEFGSYPTGAYTTMTGTLKTSKYLSDPLPNDPVSTKTYYYTPASPATSYYLCAKLDVTGAGNSTTTNSITGSGDYLCVTQP